MEFGVHVFPTEYSIQPDEVAPPEMEQARIKRIILTILAGPRDQALPTPDRLAKIIG